MSTSWGNEDDMELDDELVYELEQLISPSRRNNGEIGIGTRDYYDRLDRMAREISDKPR